MIRKKKKKKKRENIGKERGRKENKQEAGFHFPGTGRGAPPARSDQPCSACLPPAVDESHAPRGGSDGDSGASSFSSILPRGSGISRPMNAPPIVTSAVTHHDRPE